MYSVKYETDDLFEYIKSVEGPILIPHIVNNMGQWGAGFVVPLGKHFPEAKNSYLRLYSALNMGDVDFVKQHGVYIANMMVQNNKDALPTTTLNRRIKYTDLTKCLVKVKSFCEIARIETIIAPLFGSGIAGGDWDIIEELIMEYWQELNVIIVQRPGEQLR